MVADSSHCLFVHAGYMCGKVWTITSRRSVLRWGWIRSCGHSVYFSCWPHRKLVFSGFQCRKYQHWQF